MLTAYLQDGSYQLLVQEHSNTVASALRPRHVLKTTLWAPGDLDDLSNKDLLLSITGTLMEVVNPISMDAKRLPA
jgi:hypothetical protein